MEVVVVLLLMLALNLLGELNMGSGLDSRLSPILRDFFSNTEHTVVSSSVSETSLSIKGLSPTKLSSFLSLISGLSATPPVRPAPPAAHLSSSHRLPQSFSPKTNFCMPLLIVYRRGKYKRNTSIRRSLKQALQLCFPLLYMKLSSPPIPFSKYCISSLSGVKKSRWAELT